VASVVWPETLAPATGRPVVWSVTVNVAGWPVRALVGPLTLSTFLPAPPSAKTTSSPSASCVWQPCPVMSWPLR
jgi:hypothetical protein